MSGHLRWALPLVAGLSLAAWTGIAVGQVGRDQRKGAAAATVEQLLEAVRRLGAAAGDAGKAPPATTEREALRSAREVLDIPGVSRFVLGPAWNRLSASQRQKFVRLFTVLIERRALPKAGEFFADVAIAFRGETRSGERARVTTTATSKDRGEVVIAYDVGVGPRGFHIEDVILDGVSLRNNLRSEVQKVVTEHSFEELLRRMQRRLEAED